MRKAAIGQTDTINKTLCQERVLVIVDIDNLILDR